MSLVELKKILKEGKFIIGTDKTIKALREGNLKKIYLSSNCRGDIKSKIERYTKISKVDVEILNVSNEELGTLAKKQFSISVISVK